MLCQFTFKNFLSYKDETVFDMQAVNIDEFKESLIYSGKDNKLLLPVSVFYGPNGGGKSNVLQALSCLITQIVNPIRLLDKNHRLNIMMMYEDCEPFIFDDLSKNEPTEFEIFFRTSKYEYRYNLSLFNGKVNAEYLYRKAIGGKRTAMLFSRSEGEIELGSLLKKSKISKEVNEKMPYLSFLSITYNLPIIKDSIEWFEKCILINCANHSLEEGIFFSENPNFKKMFITMLNGMDIDISDFRIKINKEEKEVDIFTKHIIDGKEYELNLLDESAGTAKVFCIIPQIIISLVEGRLTVLDELDIKLHPKLLRFIISLYKNPQMNKKGSQLIFTSHCLTTMKNDLFRRDEIWFAAKNKKESSEIYSLYDIRDENGERIRANSAFDKQYMEGRYGADPYLTTMLNWEV